MNYYQVHQNIFNLYIHLLPKHIFYHLKLNDINLLYNLHKQLIFQNKLFHHHMYNFPLFLHNLNVYFLLYFNIIYLHKYYQHDYNNIHFHFITYYNLSLNMNYMLLLFLNNHLLHYLIYIHLNMYYMFQNLVHLLIFHLVL